MMINELTTDSWVISAGNQKVHYDSFRLLEFLGRNNSISKPSLTNQEIRLIATLASCIEQEFGTTYNPAMIWTAFIFGYEYAKLLGRENVSLHEGSTASSTEK